MKWSEFSIHTSNEAVDAISNILHEAGASGVVIEDSLELEKVRLNLNLTRMVNLIKVNLPLIGKLQRNYGVRNILGKHLKN